MGPSAWEYPEVLNNKVTLPGGTALAGDSKYSTSGICTGPAHQLHVFITDLEDMAECPLKFADDTKLGGAGGTGRGRTIAQGDVIRLQEWVDGKLVKFNKEKHMREGRTKPL